MNKIVRAVYSVRTPTKSTSTKGTCAMTKKPTEEFWRRLQKVVKRNPTAAAVDKVFAEFKHIANYIGVDASEEPERAKLLKRAMAIGDKRTSGKGPINVTSTRKDFLDGAIFEVTVTGGSRAGRTKVIEAVNLAVSSVFEDQPNVLHIDSEDSDKGAHTKKGRASRKVPISPRE
jgi:hypothetical protein